MAHSFLVTGDEKHRIEFEDGAWIDIKRSVSGIEGARWVSASIKNKVKVTGRGKSAVSENEQTQDLAAFMTAKLTAIVAGWSEPIPVDVALLSDTAVNRIMEEFDKLNPSGEDEALGESESPSLPIME